ncbi:D-aminoacyl-tRNA deacylase [Metaclostridioides mangenotii]|jgi:D-tyrosyl-tRNA(Tyr) deacylase|uniref:D-aminoacyl-tRNA deacylase n=1 Tax=Metaclostridioides mangenotii TaxID=1540 RepID=A0ABS4EBL3_9FIRM|nr:D-aminoacyl-tRNA deacylase [Clostridioides mangenotii]MBP1855328.1 D-tyrosyl-tRNA(Tyr) deacylase [Clostridioides mangenotii]
MRSVVQRVSSSSVTVDGDVIGKIDKGLMVLLGVTHDDTSKDVDYMIDKILNLRIFEDEDDKMNLSLKDIDGELLVVSQFTLYGDCRKGRRPSFTSAAKPDLADKLYEEFIAKAKSQGLNVGTGQFGAHMMVDLTNDGPVTILLDSSKSF